MQTHERNGPMDASLFFTIVSNFTIKDIYTDHKSHTREFLTLKSFVCKINCYQFWYNNFDENQPDTFEFWPIPDICTCVFIYTCYYL